MTRSPLILVAALVLTLLPPGAIAQTTAPDRPSAAAPPAPAQPLTDLASFDECVKSAMDLFQVSEQRRLTEERKDRLEELLVRMETHCEARQFQEASSVARDIRAMIEAN